MTKGFSQYQQSQLGVSAAKARAISERSEAQFRTGLTAIQEKEALERAADQLEKIAKEASKNAAKRGRKVSFGRLIGGTLGFVLGGPAGKAALGTALGSLAGSAAAGGFKKYDVEVPDSLVPGGFFYGREREAFKQRAEDVEQAFKDLTRAQRQGIAKNLITDYVAGRGLGKLGQAKIGDLDITIDELRALGKEGVIDYSGVDYLKDIAKSALPGGIGEDRLSELTKLSKTNITPRENFISALGTDKRLESIRTALEPDLTMDTNVLNFSEQDVLEKLRDIRVQNVSDASPSGNSFLNVNDETKKAFELFKSNQQIPPALQQNRTMFDALNRERNVLMGSPSGSGLAETVRNYGGGVRTSVLPVSNETMNYPAFFDDLVDMGVMTNRQVDDYFDNPDSLAREFDSLYGNRSRATSVRNSLFQSSVGPMGGI